MRHRAVGMLLAPVAVLLLLLAPPPAAGQDAAAGSSSPPVTSWGDPDLQGVWTNTTTTPLERPEDLAGKEVLTDEEWALRNPEAGLSDDRPSGDPVGFYNDYWLEQGELSRRTSLIVKPADGRLPAATPAEQELQRGRKSSYSSIGGASFDTYTDFNTYDRCITRGMPGAMTPGFYNHNYQILQTPDHVAIVVEMIHDARIIPLDDAPGGRAAVSPAIRQWLGDARGYWDGDTLVVESTNFNDRIGQRTGTVSGGDEHLHVVERFTRIDADTIDYRVTVTDPTVWTGSWTASMPMTALDGSLYEYACHEGNYFLPNALRGSRAEEAAAAPASK